MTTTKTHPEPPESSAPHEPHLTRAKLPAAKRAPAPAARTIKAAAASRRKLSEARRAAAERSLRVFAETYLTGQFKDPPSRMHLEVIDMLEASTQRRGMHLAIAAPRGHAKSTLVSLAYVLWSICFKLEPFIVLISDTGEQAKDLLSDVRKELEANERLAEDFPDATRPPPPAPPGQPPTRWRRDDMVAGNGVRIIALGSGQKIRGRRNRCDRPSLIVVDDLENEASARSPEQREMRTEWLLRSVMNAGTKATNIVVVGTIVHFEGVLSRLTDPVKSPGWTGRVFRAVEHWAERRDLWDQWEAIYSRLEVGQEDLGPDAARAFFDAREKEMLEGSGVLWPERESYYDLMVQRILSGHASFEAEKQNSPINPVDCVFADTRLVFWEDPIGGGFKSPEDLVAQLGPSYGRMVGACDPSLGQSRSKGDLTAIAVLYFHRRTKTCYVLDMDMRRRTPDEAMDVIIAYHKRWRFSEFAVETTQFQEVMKRELERRARIQGRFLRVRSLKPTTNKIQRIAQLQPLIATGLVRFSRRHAALIEQLRQFPHGAHDDGPDALEMAVHTANKPAAYIVPGELIW